MSELDPLARPSRNRDRVQLTEALTRAGRIRNYRVSIDDTREPDHRKTLIASAQIVALSGRLCPATGGHRQHKVAQDLAAAAVIGALHRQEPDQPLSLERTSPSAKHQGDERAPVNRGAQRDAGVAAPPASASAARSAHRTASARPGRSTASATTTRSGPLVDRGRRSGG